MSSVVVGIFPFSIHFLRYLPHLVFPQRRIFSLLPPVSLLQKLHRPQSHLIFDYPASLSVLHQLRISIMLLLKSWQRSIIGEVQKSLLGQCVKSVEVNFSGLHFTVFELNAEIYCANLRFSSNTGKYRQEKTSHLNEWNWNRKEWHLQ